MAEFYLGNLLRIPALLKIGQIIFLIITIGIAQGSDIGFRYSKHSNALGYGIVIGYMIVYLILIICYLVGETGTQRSKFELLLCVVGSVLFLSLAIYEFVKVGDTLGSSIKTKIVFEGIFLLLTACCQILDAVFIFKRGSE